MSYAVDVTGGGRHHWNESLRAIDEINKISHIRNDANHSPISIFTHRDNLFHSSGNFERKGERPEMVKFFKQKQIAVYENVLSSTEGERKEIASLKQELIALRLNVRSPAVTKWLAAVDKKLPDALDTVADIVLHDKPIDDVRGELASHSDQLKSSIDELGSATDITPNTGAINSRFADLRKIGALRAILR